MPALHSGEIGNPNLAPERRQEWEVGADASLFNERLSLNATYYRQNTRDALLRRPVAPSMGFAATELTNIGALSNRVNYCDRIPPWTFGLTELMTNLAQRALI